MHFQRASKNSLNHTEDAAVTFKEREFPAELPGPEYKVELVWRNVAIFLFLHLGALYGITRPVNSWWTILFSKCLVLHSHVNIQDRATGHCLEEKPKHFIDDAGCRLESASKPVPLTGNFWSRKQTADSVEDNVELSLFRLAPLYKILCRFIG